MYFGTSLMISRTWREASSRSESAMLAMTSWERAMTPSAQQEMLNTGMCGMWAGLGFADGTWGSCEVGGMLSIRWVGRVRDEEGWRWGGELRCGGVSHRRLGLFSKHEPGAALKTCQRRDKIK